jgi:hypothetical protein
MIKQTDISGGETLTANIMPAETMEENSWRSLKELLKKTHEVFAGKC